MSTYRKKINYKKYMLIIGGFLLVLIYLTSIPANAYVVGQSNPNNYNKLLGPVGLDEEVIVMTDPDDDLFSSASDSIVESTHSVYTSVKKANIKTLDDINKVIKTPNLLILVWSFNTTLQGIPLSSGETIPWIGIAKLVVATPEINHIFNM